MITWFSSYLSDRIQYVVIGDSRSVGVVPTSGVPHGSILGPLLFIIFINDLLSSLQSCSGFADDLKIISRGFREQVSDNKRELIGKTTLYVEYIK